MKKIITVLIMFSIMSLLLPLVSVSFAGGSPSSSATTPTKEAPPVLSEAPVVLLDFSTNELLTISMREYLIGAVSTEMPVSYQQEAIKAQTVATHSYILSCKVAQENIPDPALKGAYISVKSAAYEGFATVDGLKTRWGDNFDANYKYICEAVDSVLTETLEYKGEIALTTYYAISNGSTEASEAIWSEAKPYLTRVDMPLDKTSTGYEVEKSMTAQEVYDALSMNFTALNLSAPPDEWLTEIERSPAGYISTIECGGQVLKGLDVRMALGLRSSDFDIVCDDDNKFTFTTRGYGHGVGLSQHGSNQLAISGKDYKDILKTFYPGTKLKKA